MYGRLTKKELLIIERTKAAGEPSHSDGEDQTAIPVIKEEGVGPASEELRTSDPNNAGNSGSARSSWMSLLVLAVIFIVFVLVAMSILRFLH